MNDRQCYYCFVVVIRHVAGNSGSDQGGQIETFARNFGLPVECAHDAGGIVLPVQGTGTHPCADRIPFLAVEACRLTSKNVKVAFLFFPNGCVVPLACGSGSSAMDRAAQWAMHTSLSDQLRIDHFKVSIQMIFGDFAGRRASKYSLRCSFRPRHVHIAHPCVTCH